MKLWLVLLIAGPALLAGCRGDFGLRCEDPQRYAGAAEVAPVRVPDDLSVPDETGALRIPPVDTAASRRVSSKEGPCLESPPNYFEGAVDGAAPPAEPAASPPR